MHREVARWWRDGGEVAARSEVAQPDGRQVVRSAPLLQQRVCHFATAAPCRNANGATLSVLYLDSYMCTHVYTRVYISSEGRASDQ